MRIEAFTIHGHVGEEPVDYGALMELLGSIPPQDRVEIVGGRLVAIPHLKYTSGRYEFTAYTGFIDTSFLLLDLTSGGEEIRPLEPGKVVVRKTVGTIDPDRREAVVQFVHHGVRAHQVAELLELLARKHDPVAYKVLSLELSPLPGAGFLDALNELSRIQSARVRLTRPNYDWEEFGDTLTLVGSESEARNLEIAAVANRGGSLSTKSGLVEFIRELATQARSIMKNAWITGSPCAESGLVTLSLDRHIDSRTVEVPTGTGGQVDEQELRDEVRTFLDERAGQVE